MFIRLTIHGTKNPVLVAVDNIAAFHPVDKGALVSTKLGSSVQVNQSVDQIALLLKGAGLLCLD